MRESIDRACARLAEGRSFLRTLTRERIPTFLLRMCVGLWRTFGLECVSVNGGARVFVLAPAVFPERFGETILTIAFCALPSFVCWTVGSVLSMRSQ